MSTILLATLFDLRKAAIPIAIRDPADQQPFFTRNFGLGRALLGSVGERLLREDPARLRSHLKAMSVASDARFG
jgi:hypothetical protein